MNHSFTVKLPLFIKGSAMCGWSLLCVLLLAGLVAACLTKGRAAAAGNTNHAAVPESNAATTPQVTLIVSGNPIHLSAESQQKLAQQVEAIVYSSQIGPIGPIIRSIQVDYGPDQIKVTGSYLHIVYPPNKYPAFGKKISPVKEIFLGLFDNPTEKLLNRYNGGSWPGYPGSIALVSSSGDPFSDFSARSSAENGDLLIALGLNSDLHPHLTAKMQVTVDSVSAVQKGDMASLKQLIAQGVDLKSIAGPEGSLLCYAATPEMAEYLLQQGIPVDAKDSKFQPALIHVCQGYRRYSATIAPVVNVLLKHGADPNSTVMGDSSTSALMLAPDGPTVDTLVAAGAQVPPLCAWDRIDDRLSPHPPPRSLDFYQALVRHGLDLRRGPWCGSQGLSLLFSGCELGGRDDLVEWLINQGVDPDGIFYFGDYPKGLPKTPLIQCAESGNAATAKILLQHGLKLRQVIRDGKTNGELAMAAAVKANNVQLISILQAAEANNGAKAVYASASVPSFSAITSIYIALPNGWWLEVKGDGSGTFGFGSSAADSGRFPLNTLKLQKLYQDLSVQVEGGPAKESQPVVSFLSDRTCNSFNTNNREYILSIMAFAYTNSTFLDKNRVDNLLRTNPFVSK